MNITLWDKIKLGATAIFGGVEGVIKMLLDWFNDRVLAKVTDKATATLYLEDVRAFRTFLCGSFSRHTEWMSEAKRRQADKILAAIDTLAAALEDWTITPEELDAIIDAIKAAIESFKEAK